MLLPDDAKPSLPSVDGVWPAANWFEREAYDMFGFDFPGHPNLRRILCHDAFSGHALRKDYEPGQRWIFTEEDLRSPDWAKETDVRAGTSSADDQDRPVASGDARHLPPDRRLDGETIVRAETRSATSTAASRRWRRRTPGTR